MKTFILIVSLLTGDGGLTEARPVPTIELCREIKVLAEINLRDRGIEDAIVQCVEMTPRPVYRKRKVRRAVVAALPEARKTEPAKAKPVKASAKPKRKAKCALVKRYRVINGRRKWYTRCKR